MRIWDSCPSYSQKSLLLKGNRGQLELVCHSHLSASLTFQFSSGLWDALRSTSCSWLAATAFIAYRWRTSHPSECGSPAMFLGKALTVPLYSHRPPSLQDTEIQQTHFLNYITSRILVETVLEYILTSSLKLVLPAAMMEKIGKNYYLKQATWERKRCTAESPWIEVPRTSGTNLGRVGWKKLTKDEVADVISWLSL